MADFFEVRFTLALRPRYNIAPSQDVLAVRVGPEGRQVVNLHWGLIPRWAKGGKSDYSMINARAETIADKPAFRDAFRHRRCLIPVTGFYEWQQVDKVKGKLPHLIQVGNGELFAFAGIWERWEGKKGNAIESCSVIVTTANDLIQPMHERIPVILDREDHETWLDPENNDPDLCRELLRSYPAAQMNTRAIGLRVNNPRNDDSECIAPAD